VEEVAGFKPKLNPEVAAGVSDAVVGVDAENPNDEPTATVVAVDIFNALASFPVVEPDDTTVLGFPVNPKLNPAFPDVTLTLDEVSGVVVEAGIEEVATDVLG